MTRSVRLVGSVAAALALLAAIVVVNVVSGGDQEPNPGAVHWNRADGCPPQLATSATTTHNTGAGLGSRLLPTGITTGALICRYHSNDATPPATVLATSKTLDPASAGQLAAAIRAITSHGAGGSHGCPGAYAGTVTIMIFGYPDRPDIDLWFNTSGCQTLSNGNFSTEETANPAFYDGFAKAFARLAS